MSESERVYFQASDRLVPQYFREQRHVELIEALKDKIDPEVWSVPVNQIKATCHLCLDLPWDLFFQVKNGKQFLFQEILGLASPARNA